MDPTRRDLASNEPGAKVRARAEQLRRQAPLRTFVARALGVHTEERDFRIGAEGEMAVARRLRRLDRSRWLVLHSVAVGRGGSDIDHLVIGPGGVFSLNTKHHPGGRVWVGRDAVVVNGHRTAYLPCSRFESRRAAGLLSGACGFPVAVHPVIVVLAARLTIRQQPADVHVADGRTVVRWLSRCATVLPPDEVAAIFDQARRRATWRAGGR